MAKMAKNGCFPTFLHPQNTPKNNHINKRENTINKGKLSKIYKYNNLLESLKFLKFVP